MKESTLVGLFDEYEDAKGALSDLVSGGIAREKIALLANGASSHHPGVLSNPAYAREDMEKPEADATSALGLGVVIGAGILGILGYLIGHGMGATGDTNAVASAIAALSPEAAKTAGNTWILVAVGAAIGAIIGGIVGWMLDKGPSEEDEKLYAEGLKHSGTLITVHVTDDLVDQVKVIFKARGAVDVETREANWRADGWVSFDPDSITRTASHAA
ncbi:MAG TPA: hypothetical protein VKZ79_04585 [Alphaproteobacteria bacterium]|nr:hypothetical protein [Alphaproteobacteria bacterium]